MTASAPLLEELDRWQASGRTATFWLRDDDAVEPSGALDELLSRSAAASVPVMIAVIPMCAAAVLAERLAVEPHAKVWQHGIAHSNNAGPGQKKQELTGADSAVLQRLEVAWTRLSGLFGAQAEPVLVPPWNRIDPRLIPNLPALGFQGLSTFRPRPGSQAAPGLWRVNTHIDVIDWKNGKKFIGLSEAFNEIAAHLLTRRIERADPDEPTGILTHHLVMDEFAWAFLSDLFALTNSHPAARWCAPNRQ